jgi:hypothetical protein
MFCIRGNITWGAFPYLGKCFPNEFSAENMGKCFRPWVNIS